MASNSTFKITETELIKLGFSHPAARALQRALDAIGSLSVDDPTVAEINSVLSAYVSTESSGRQEISDIRKIVEGIQANQYASTRINEMEKRIANLEARVSTA